MALPLLWDEMAARLNRMAARTTVEDQLMIQARSVETSSGLAPLPRVRPGLQAVCKFGAQLAADHAAEADRWAPFHFITDGACVVELNDTGRSIPLSAGDGAGPPHGSRHTVPGSATPPGARGPLDRFARQ